jgi:hypothetical protein
MKKPLSNPCIRCGKERILIKSWNEQIGLALTTFTTARCPDDECQKLVDRENELREAKKQLHTAARAESKQRSLSHISTSRKK